MKNIELEYIATIIIALVVIIVGTNILFVTVSGTSISDVFVNSLNKFVGFIFSGRAYNICEDFNNRHLTLEEFQSLLLAMEREECGSAQVQLRFSLTEKDIKKIIETTGIKKTLLILEGSAKPLGANALLVYGNPGPRPLKLDDEIELKRAGTPRPDIMITLLKPGCDPFDDDCDASCSYKSGICDPMCYKHEQLTGEQCDIDCVDVNKNGEVDAGDIDDICDLDCYNNMTDPSNAYDPDCIKLRQQNDDVCDPDSNGIRDGYCDPDCAGDNFICDFDCDGKDGRPYDRECYECDKRCNNFCSPACTKDDADGDCIDGFGTRSACCGNNKCEAGETCGTNDIDLVACDKDCPVGTTCAGLYTGNIPQGKDAICCPEGSASDEYGCGVYEVNLPVGSACSCDAQCSQTPEQLQCNPGFEVTGNYCCPSGKQWNGTECVVPKVYNIVFVPLYYSTTDTDLFRNNAQQSFDYFVSVSPFRECSNPLSRVKLLIIDPKDCQVSSCSDICSDCQSRAMSCVSNSPYNGVWDKVIGLCKGNSCRGACGCANGIPADSSLTNFQDCRAPAYRIPSHEGGHSFGLYHLRSTSGVNGCWDNEGGPCQGPNRADCQLSANEISECIMPYCPSMNKYCPAGYDHLKNVVFKDYLVGC